MVAEWYVPKRPDNKPHPWAALREWSSLDEEGRRAIVARAIEAVVDPKAPSAPHPLVGLYAHRSSTDPEVTKYGWNHERQIRVHSVVGDIALAQYYSYLDGAPTSIEPIAVSELLSGAWRFYASHAEWKETADEASERYWNAQRYEADALRRRTMAIAAAKNGQSTSSETPPL